MHIRALKLFLSMLKCAWLCSSIEPAEYVNIVYTLSFQWNPEFPFPVALTLSAFGGGSGAIFLDDVECIGAEERLEHCSHHGIGVHDCDHSNDAGVKCDLGTIRN